MILICVGESNPEYRYYETLSWRAHETTCRNRNQNITDVSQMRGAHFYVCVLCPHYDSMWSCVVIGTQDKTGTQG